MTQHDIAQYIVGKRDAHYHFTVKGNQPNLLKDIELYFEKRQHPDFVEGSSLEHGRIETRKIWTTSELNDYLDFPHIGQTFVIERWVEHKKSGKKTMELAYVSGDLKMLKIRQIENAASYSSVFFLNPHITNLYF